MDVQITTVSAVIMSKPLNKICTQVVSEKETIEISVPETLIYLYTFAVLQNMVGTP